MPADFSAIVGSCELSHLEPILRSFAEPAAGFSLASVDAEISTPVSKLGGRRYLPRNFVWPTHKSKPLDVLLQVNLGELAPFDCHHLLPATGLLTFLYDVNEQPWGYDPADLSGATVLYFPDVSRLQTDPASADSALPERRLSFFSMLTLPRAGSHAWSRLMAETKMGEDDRDAYADLPAELESAYGPQEQESHRVLYLGNHHFFGHSSNIQESTPDDDWLLLLQLDSDDSANLMWGDCGTLYYWIRKADLHERRFENVRMDVQCY